MGLKEMVNSFSEQKVQSVTEIENLTKELQKSNELGLNFQKSLDEVSKKYDQLETEKLVQERQVRRLLNENQELLEQIDALDNALKSSKDEIITLSTKNQSFEIKFQESNAEIICLKQKCQDLEGQISVQAENEKTQQKSMSEELEKEKMEIET